MDAKELKIQAPEGYEIDKENSTLECIKFKPIKKNITYKDICNTLFTKEWGFFISTSGDIEEEMLDYYAASEKNNATNRKQLEKVLALNQLLNIATYYNSKVKEPDDLYTISYNNFYDSYCVSTKTCYITGMTALFTRKEDAQEVIDNPNFREILDTIYKN